MYPAPITELEEIKDQFNDKDFIVAKKVAERLLTIPIHRLLSKKDKEGIIAQLSAISSQPSDINTDQSIINSFLLKAKR